MEVAKRIAEILESETLAMTKKARELKEQGKDVISLSIGEPDFNTPEHICKAAYDAMLAGNTHYTPVLGSLAFREAICRKLKRENNLDYKTTEIIVSNGAKHSIINAVLSIINPGDEAIILSPYWVSYPTMVDFAGGKNVFVTAGIDQDFKVTATQIESAITDKTKLLIFSSPSNPTGSVYSKQELESIAAMLQKYPNVFVISDEIYEKINYGVQTTSIASLPGMKERTATVNGLAKGFAMTGWRIGYLAGPAWLVSACEKMQGLFTSGANSVSQMAGIAALEGEQEPVEQMRLTFAQRKEKIVAMAQQLPNVKVNNPEGAFYIFPDFSYYIGKKTSDGKTIENTEDLCYYILEKGGVAMVSGAAFGAPGYVRISYATDIESIEKGMERVAEVLRGLG